MCTSEGRERSGESGFATTPTCTKYNRYNESGLPHHRLAVRSRVALALRNETALDSRVREVRQRPHMRSVCDRFCPALKTLQVEQPSQQVHSKASVPFFKVFEEVF